MVVVIDDKFYEIGPWCVKGINIFLIMAFRISFIFDNNVF